MGESAASVAGWSWAEWRRRLGGACLRNLAIAGGAFYISDPEVFRRLVIESWDSSGTGSARAPAHRVDIASEAAATAREIELFLAAESRRASPPQTRPARRNGTGADWRRRNRAERASSGESE